MEIKLIKIGEIKPRPNNPKKHWVEKISESIREFGYVEPIVVDEGDVILAGHGRLKALREQGVAEVEVIVKRGLTEAQKDKYMLLSNKVCEAGGWDEELLEKFDKELLEGVGFKDDELRMRFGLGDIEDENIDFERLRIIMVEAPEAPRLKERCSIYFESIDDYKKVKDAVKSGKINGDELLKLI